MLVYNISADSWEVFLGDVEACWPSARVSATVTSLRDPSKFLLYGGDTHHKNNTNNKDNKTEGAFIFDSKTRSWISISRHDDSEKVKGHSGTLLPNGSVLFYGGYNGTSSWSSEVYIVTISDTNNVETKGADETTTLEEEEEKEEINIKKKRRSVQENNVEMSQEKPCKRARRGNNNNNNNASKEMKQLFENMSKEMQKDWDIKMQNILSAVKKTEEERKIAEFESDARRAELLRAEKLIQELSKEKFVFKERLMHAERRLKESQDREKELRSYHEKLDRALSSTSAMTDTIKELGTLKASYLKVTLERDTEKRLKNELVQENRDLQVQIESLKRKLKDQNRKFDKFVREMKEDVH